VERNPAEPERVNARDIGRGLTSPYIVERVSSPAYLILPAGDEVGMGPMGDDVEADGMGFPVVGLIRVEQPLMIIKRVLDIKDETWRTSTTPYGSCMFLARRKQITWVPLCRPYNNQLETPRPRRPMCINDRPEKETTS
jgi:hypothetical protein